ncbi:hypothetical protein TVNIR_2271 [Thioalkalivibrio nitratireducens DSM 14787]|uniref:Uncharacterized protein n=1 Tax=Thioalkalivibrio nitratireducens (strain DSM 14787 / UNIQEM 213 / ALEN2) TaxID=1255043 RepID=L0DYA0_THIND|nr:hypothetical protein TVNIR_2271 [Thioalkalivibrio nitratireducens DSM 14787]
MESNRGGGREMPQPRSSLVSPSDTPWYQVASYETPNLLTVAAARS